jgi:hypothetical protein
VVCARLARFRGRRRHLLADDFQALNGPKKAVSPDFQRTVNGARAGAGPSRDHLCIRSNKNMFTKILYNGLPIPLLLAAAAVTQFLAVSVFA